MTQKLSPKVIGISIAALLITTFSSFYAYKKMTTPLPLDAPFMGIPVESDQAQTGAITRRVNVTGNLKAMQSVTIRPEIHGKIAKIFYESGEYVEKNSPLLKIDDRLYKAEVMESQAKVKLMETTYKRAKTLTTKGAGALKKEEEAYANLQMARAKYDQAKVKLENTLIKAPFDGHVGLKEVSEGMFVTEQTELLTIVDEDPIRIDFRVPARYIKFINPGQKLEVQVDGFQDDVFTAAIESVDAQVDQITHSLKVRAIIPNEKGVLKPGLFARVNLVVGAKDDAVLIPDNAILSSGDEEYVFRSYEVEDKGEKIKVSVKTPITTGMKEKGFTEVVRGLKSGDEVITIGNSKLKHGVPIRIVADVEVEDIDKQ